MKRLVALLSLFASTAIAADPLYRTMSAIPDNDATVRLDGKLKPILFEPASVRVTVRLQTATGKASHAWPADWVRDVRFTITDEGSIRSRDVHAEVLRQQDEQVRIEDRVVEHAAAAEFRLPPLPHGRYGLTVSYDGLSQSTPGPLIVVRGDETAEIREWSLQRQLEKAKTWEEAKRLLVARTENLPRSPAPWFALAAGAEQREDYETTKRYYEKAMALTIENGGEGAEEAVRGVKRILELLPAYYADREHLVIVLENLGMPGMPVRVELRERRPLAPRAPEKK
jgi:tetratricopeptide (TPR) repeat protein